jgi:hypothetical protein
MFAFNQELHLLVLYTNKKAAVMNLPVSKTGMINFIPGLQESGGFNASPSTIISSGPKG